MIISGVNKKVDKKIIFIMKIRGVVEGLYLEMQKAFKNRICNKYIFRGAIKC